MLVNCDLSKPLYVLGHSVHSEELVEFVKLEHTDVRSVHHDEINKLALGSQCLIGFANIEYRIRVINDLENTMTWPTYIHPTALVESTVTIAEGCVVYPFTTVMHKAGIGKFSAIFTHAHVSHGTIVGKNVVVCPGTIIGGSTIIGNNVFIGQASSVKDKISICSNTRFGMSSVVSKNINEPGNYLGNRKSNIVV